MSESASTVIIEAPEKAFRDSAQYTFLDKRLEPFSHLRQTAAIALGLKYWSLGEEDFQHIKNDQKKRLKDKKLSPTERSEIEAQPDEIVLYGGIYHDIAILMWLCHQSDATCRKARWGGEHGQRDEWEEQIDKWADKNAVVFKGKNLTEAMSIFFDIVNDANQSTGIPETTPELEGDDDDP